MTLRAQPDPELVDWFRTEIDKGDAPELHLVGLQPGELVRCFDAIGRSGARWNDRTFYLEGSDVTVAERPDVASLVAHGRADHACVGAHGITVQGVELPLLEMFLFSDEIRFFWWPGADWTTERAAALFGLLDRLLTLAPGATLHPDPRYPEPARRRLADLISQLISGPCRP
jgi:hypothetical protein